jgi:hypothetical protein
MTCFQALGETELGKSSAYITINLIFIYTYAHVPYLPTYKTIPTSKLSIYRMCLPLCVFMKCPTPTSDDKLGTNFCRGYVC